MHIASGICSVSVCVAGAGLAAGALLASRWLGREQESRLTAGGLAALTAAVFAAQMLNAPVGGGTSGHLVGGALLGILAGPCVGLIAMIAILATQALLFADGGIAALGLNILNMGVVGVLGGWALHRALAGPGRLSSAAVAGMAGFAVALAGAALVAVELALSGSAPFASALAAMVGAHARIGLIEAGLTAVAVAALHRPAGAPAIGFRAPAAAAVVACAIAPFASALPDGLDHTAEQLGFADRAMAGSAPFADYLVPGLPAMLAVVVAGLIGAAVVAAAMRAVPALRRS